MRRQVAPTLALIALLLFSVPFLATPQKSSQAPKQAVSGQMPLGEQMAQMLKGKPLLPQGSDGGFWRTDHAFVSTLMLKNILLIAPISVTPVLYMADGTEDDLTPVNLDAAGVAVLNINDALQNAPASIQSHISTYGSAGIRFNWLWAGAVTAAVRTGDDIRSLVYQSHAHADITKVNDPAAIQSPQTLEGMWWKQDANTKCFITLTNTSKNSISANVQISDSDASNVVGKAVVVPSHNTQYIDVTSLWSQLPYASAQGALRVSFTATRDALVVEGGLEDDITGYSHALRIGAAPAQTTSSPFSTLSVGGGASATALASTPAISPSQAGMPAVTPAETINLDSPGVMTGTQDADMQFPQGTQFVPYIILRNMTGMPIQVRLTANYLNGATPTDVSLGNVTLPAQTVQQVGMNAMLAAAGLGSYNGFLNLKTSFFGHSSDIMEESGSIDQSQSYVFEVPPVMEGSSRGKILAFWNSTGDTDSMISMWNYSGKDQDFLLTLYHQAGEYKLPIHLAANASVTVSVAALIKSGTPDADGNTIPANTVQGSAKLSGPRGDMDIIDVALHGAVFNVRTGTCTCICTYCNYVTCSFLTPGNLTEGVGEVTNECAFVVLYDGCCCNISFDMDWNTSSGSSSIATVDGNGDVTGDGPGVTTISGHSGSTFATTEYADCNGYPSDWFCDMEFVPFSAQITVTPVITSITPAKGAAGGTTSVTISGMGLSSATVNSISGITVTVTSSSTTEVDASFAVSGSASGGNADVAVTANGQSSNSVTFFVQIPSSLSIVGGTNFTASEASCTVASTPPVPGCGNGRGFVYQVIDQTGSGAIQTAGLAVWDSFGTASPDPLGMGSNFATTCGGPGPCGPVTDSSGQFDEFPSAGVPGLRVCSSVCKSSGSCITGGPSVVNQTWHVGSSTVVQQIKYFCDHITVNGQ